MTIAFDTSVNANSAGGTAALVMPGITTAGTNEILVMECQTNGSPVTSITGGSGITWTNRGVFAVPGPGNLEIWTAPAALVQSGTVFTVNTTSSGFIEAVIMAFSGVNTASPIDPNGSLPASASNSSQLSISTSNANDVMVSIGNDTGSTTDPTWTKIAGLSFVVAIYKIVSTTQSAVFWSTGGFQNCIATALVQAAGGDVLMSQIWI